MINCLNCGHGNMTGAAFCMECGAALLPTEFNTTQKIAVEPGWGEPIPRQQPNAERAPSSDNWVTLHLVETGEMLALGDKNEFTLGRATEGQPVMPDVDLGPFQAYTHGVSRLHAAIRRGVDDIYVMDLDSANGTYVNGTRLEANEERGLSHGDVIALGRLKLQVLLKSM